MESVIYTGPERYERQELPESFYTVTLEAIVEKYGVRTAADFGCGLGCDVAMMASQGLKVYGLDGSEELRPYLLFHGDYRVGDLQEQLDLEPVDLVWCREVAEHLPAGHAPTLVANVARHCRVCYFTAAHPGQIGSGHVNCQPREYWIDLFANEGMGVDVELTALNARHPNADDRDNGIVFA